MPTNTLTVKVPQELLARLRDRARQSKRTVDAEVVDLLTDAIGEEEALPADIVEAMAAVERLDDKALREALSPLMTRKQAKRFADLNRKAQDAGLTVAERREQDELLHVYDKSMLVRAAVMAELKKRGVNVAELIAK
jgi:plasmid stability protein